MDAMAWHDLRAATVWSVKGRLLRESQPPGARWWWSNRERRPEGCVVAQYIRRGRIIWRERGAERELGPGHLFLFAFGEDSAYGRPPDRPDWTGHADHLQMDHVTLQGAGLQAYWDLFRARSGSVLVLPADAPCLAALHTLCMAKHAPTGFDAIAQVAAFVAELGRACAAPAGSARPPVEQAVEAILEDPFTEHNLKAISQRCGCSREHLSRIFRDRVGEPPVAWMRERRIARAVELLRETARPIGVVATQCGAGSVHRLGRWTHMAFGLSPAELGRELKAGRMPKRRG
jgi:AraC-like DNA-binding protein